MNKSYPNFAIINKSYIGNRKDILNIVPHEAVKILDIGCSIGTLGSQIKQRQKAKVVGIELDKKMAKKAEEKLDRVIIGNIELINLKDYYPLCYFDCIIFADVLEHLKDPWKILENCKDFLNENGCVISSIPNVRHYSTLYNLLIKGYWPYRERGIHDINHLRFFTKKNISEMFKKCGLNIVTFDKKYRILERGHWLDKYIKYFCIFLKEFFVFQYLIVAKKI